jgi:L,D-peptidoglycan transpeptidase YkuD (ErfK/YbiS/YcfS/YnhG family)
VRTVRLIVIAAIAASMSVGVAGAIGMVDIATVDVPAMRDVAFTTDAICDIPTVEALADRHPGVRQFVVMATDSFGRTNGTVEVAVRTDAGDWSCQRGAQAAQFGRAGTRPLADRRSGDGTTPAGVFPLGVTTAWDGQVFAMFGNQPDPGVLASYRDVRPQDCWGATPGTSRYQHLVNRPRCPGPDDEWLQGFGDAYAHAAVIGANLDPVSGDQPGEPPYAAAIFLHRASYSADGSPKATSGCVSLGYDDLVTTLRMIDPRLEPHFAIGPTDWLRASA